MSKAGSQIASICRLIIPNSKSDESINLSCQANPTCVFVIQLNFSTSYAAKLLGGQKDVTTGHARSCNSISHTLLVVVDRSSINHSITRLQSPLHLAKKTIIQVKNPANFLHQDLNWLWKHLLVCWLGWANIFVAIYFLSWDWSCVLMPEKSGSYQG